jgi:hypothetical protein
MIGAAGVGFIRTLPPGRGGSSHPLDPEKQLSRVHVMTLRGKGVSDLTDDLTKKPDEAREVARECWEWIRKLAEYPAIAATPAFQRFQRRLESIPWLQTEPPGTTDSE